MFGMMASMGWEVPTGTHGIYTGIDFGTQVGALVVRGVVSETEPPFVETWQWTTGTPAFENIGVFRLKYKTGTSIANPAAEYAYDHMELPEGLTGDTVRTASMTGADHWALWRLTINPSPGKSHIGWFRLDIPPRNNYSGNWFINPAEVPIQHRLIPIAAGDVLEFQRPATDPAEHKDWRFIGKAPRAWRR